MSIGRFAVYFFTVLWFISLAIDTPAPNFITWALLSAVLDKLGGREE